MRRPTILASRCRRASCAFIAATPTASCNLSAKTPLTTRRKNETVRVTTGNAFDLVGERKQTNFHVDTGDKWIDESFEIKLRNHKKEPVEIRVVEHLYRWSNWEITARSPMTTPRKTRRPSNFASQSSRTRNER